VITAEPLLACRCPDCGQTHEHGHAGEAVGITTTSRVTDCLAGSGHVYLLIVADERKAPA